MRCKTIVLLLFFSIKPLLANDSLKGQKTTFTHRSSNSQKYEVKMSAYKLLYENQKDSNDKILQTVYWALGGIFSVVFVVIGSSIYFNVKFNNKEVELTAAELQRKFEEAKNSYLIEINQKITNEASDLKKTIDNEKQHLSNTYQELLKSYSENLSQQILTIKESFDEKERILIKKISESEKTLDTKLKETINYESNKLKRGTLNNEAEIYFLKNNFNNALKIYLDIAILEFEMNYNDWAFEYSSRNIIKCLEKVSHIYTDESELINTLFELSKEKFPLRTDEIIALLKGIPVKKLGD